MAKSTAAGAENKESNSTQEDFLKIRLQGTVEDMEWFQNELGGMQHVEMEDFSKPLPNKGTKKYYRMYGKIKRK